MFVKRRIGLGRTEGKERKKEREDGVILFFQTARDLIFAYQHMGTNIEYFNSLTIMSMQIVKQLEKVQLKV